MKLFLKSILVLAFLSGLNAQETSKPNIVFILADDFGYGEREAR